MENNVIQKYLMQYAEPETQFTNSTNDRYNFVIVIPICNEEESCLGTIFKNITIKNILVVIVVNSPEVEKNSLWQQTNKIFIEFLLESSYLKYDLSDNVHWLKFNDFNDVILVDRNSIGAQIDVQQGVGLARKIGCDIALQLFKQGKIKCPWIFSTDADVVLPKNYFHESYQYLANFSAVVLEFEHFSEDDRLNLLQYYYDFKLRYYQAGLYYSASSYNYIPLGSTLVISMLAYAQVRGFPKKNAAEDFYLLNKLAKIKPVKYLHNNIVIKIKSRLSDRVPFGTGPALIKINGLQSIEDYQYYNPRCFEYLKKWNFYLQSLYKKGALRIISPEDTVLFELYDFFNCKNIFEKSSPQITSRQRWSQFVHQWFDAFRTLKAVHFFVDKLPSNNYKQLLKSNYFAKVSNPSLKSFIQKNDKT